jgi:hypothetical protein
MANIPTPDAVAVRWRFDAKRRLQGLRMDDLERRLRAMNGTPQNGASVVEATDKGWTR